MTALTEADVENHRPLRALQTGMSDRLQAKHRPRRRVLRLRAGCPGRPAEGGPSSNRIRPSPAPAREHVRGGENGARVYHFSGPVTHFQRLMDSGPEARCLAADVFRSRPGPAKLSDRSTKTKEIWDGPG